MSVQGVFLSYPIDQVGERPASTVYMYDQIEKFKRMIIESGAATWVFDPGDAFLVDPHRPVPGVAEINRVAALEAQCVVAFLPKQIASIGVPMEVDRAVQSGKMAAVLSDVKSYMLEIEGICRRFDWQDDDLYEICRWIQLNDPPQRDLATPLPIMPLSDLGQMPTRAYEDDAGLDLYVSQDTVIEPGAFVDLPCSIAMELPDWAWGLVIGRSSALRKKGLIVQQGVVDAGYRGPMFTQVYNVGTKQVWVMRGERIGQLILMVNHTKTFQPVEVSQLAPSKRGENGFGSSGA